MSEVNKYGELKLVAKKATPGPWWVDSHGMNMTSLPSLEVVFSHPANSAAVRNEETGNLSHWRNDWDASYIATANPKTILELIEDFDAQRLRADKAESALEVAQWEVKCRIGAEVNAVEALAAAEQRIAKFKGLLEESLGSVYVEAQRAETAFASRLLLGLADRIEAALNPNPEAESHE